MDFNQNFNFLEFPLLTGISSYLRRLVELYFPSALEEAKNAAQVTVFGSREQGKFAFVISPP